MITIRFIRFFLAFIVISILFITLLSGNLKSKMALANLGYIISLSLITAFCFFPFPFQQELIDDIILNNEGVLNNFIPFHTIMVSFTDAIKYHVYSELIYSILGNILLFVPLGISLFLGINGNKKTLRTLITIVIISILVESLQGLFNSLLGYNYRSVDIDDLILNSIGGMIGYYIPNKIKKILPI